MEKGALESDSNQSFRASWTSREALLPAELGMKLKTLEKFE